MAEGQSKARCTGRAQVRKLQRARTALIRTLRPNIMVPNNRRTLEHLFPGRPVRVTRFTYFDKGESPDRVLCRWPPGCPEKTAR